jgi:hypothetical protein
MAPQEHTREPDRRDDPDAGSERRARRASVDAVPLAAQSGDIGNGFCVTHLSVTVFLVLSMSAGLAISTVTRGQHGATRIRGRSCDGLRRPPLRSFYAVDAIFVRHTTGA